jgi:hypothetical protein
MTIKWGKREKPLMFHIACNAYLVTLMANRDQSVVIWRIIIRYVEELLQKNL